MKAGCCTNPESGIVRGLLPGPNHPGKRIDRAGHRHQNTTGSCDRRDRAANTTKARFVVKQAETPSRNKAQTHTHTHTHTHTKDYVSYIGLYIISMSTTCNVCCDKKARHFQKGRQEEWQRVRGATPMTREISATLGSSDTCENSTGSHGKWQASVAACGICKWVLRLRKTHFGSVQPRGEAGLLKSRNQGEKDFPVRAVVSHRKPRSTHTDAETQTQSSPST